MLGCNAPQTAATNGLGNFTSPAESTDIIIAHVRKGGLMVKIMGASDVYIHTASMLHAKIDAKDGIFLWTVCAARRDMELKQPGSVNRSWLNHRD